MFNCHANNSEGLSTTHISTDRMAQLCMYLERLRFTKARKKQQIDTLYQNGLCVSFDQVMKISTQEGEVLDI